ncbi:hypothetical protein [Streptomyces sp. NPDC002133]|uniref:hypothetical protein n=1 Tax=Streptomyces sp. NPDC002133 TaxID=3154409 RepID=UPI003333C9F2
MITPIEGPDEDRDATLDALLQPGAVLLGPPPGRFREIRRAAARRRLLRAAAGAGVSLAVAALVAVPLHLLPAPGAQPAGRPPAPPASVPPAATDRPAPSSPTPTPSATPRPRHSTSTTPPAGQNAHGRATTSPTQRPFPTSPVRGARGESR